MMVTVAVVTMVQAVMMMVVKTIHVVVKWNNSDGFKDYKGPILIRFIEDQK